MSALAVCPLHNLGLLRFQGPDTRAFLQGQLSNDLSSLRHGALLRAGLHNPQGRTLALLALSAGASEHEVVAILPRELLPAVAATLARYVLRSKVKIADASGTCQIFGISDRNGGAAASGEILRGYAPGRALLLTAEQAPAGAALAAAAACDLSQADWRALDIAAGLPQVYLPTSGQFVAQMLNLDCIEAVSFTKGCYTGQEVIARAHYRGRVKRRMQRFISTEPLQLTAGQSGALGDGRSFRVVDAVQRADGRCEFLAVAALAGGAAETEVGAESMPLTAASDVRGVQAQSLALPYALPD